MKVSITKQQLLLLEARRKGQVQVKRVFTNDQKRKIIEKLHHVAVVLQK